MRKVYFLLSLVFLISVSVTTAQENPKKIPLYNAYYLAKAIANKKITTLKQKDTLQLLLGGAIWYSNNDFKTVGDVEELLQNAEQYPVLKGYLQVIADSFYNQ